MPPKAPSKENKGENSPAAVDLLGYYRSRIDEFEKERAAMLESVGRLTTEAAERHKLEWENRKRADEIREMQKALSDAHAFLFEERQRLLTLQAENDELRLQEIEDRKRIQQLLSGGEQSGRARQQQGGVSHYSTDALLLKIESLQAQLNEQKQLASERIAALLEDRRIRESEESAHRQHMNTQLEDATQALAKAEEQLRQTTKEYILAKRDRQTADERAITAEAALHQERQQVAEDMAALKRKHERELRDQRQSVESKMDDVTSNLRHQVRTKEDEVVGLTSVHSALKSQYEQRLTELEDKVTKLKATNKQLESRRHLDMDGFAADITYLRKMLTAVDRKLLEMRLVERLDDDERLDAILATLRRKAPAPTGPHPPGLPTSAGRGGSNQGPDVAPQSDTNSVKGELAEGLAEIRGSIKGLEERLATRKKAMGSSGATGGVPGPRR